MQENKFENRVQGQMEEFRIRPSAAVWEKVEEELKKKKKRRIVFYIFLLTGVSLLGYSGYFLFNNAKPNLVHQNTALPAINTEKNNETVPGTTNSTAKAQQYKKTNQLPVEDKRDISKESVSSTQIRDIVLNDRKTSSEKNFVIKKQERNQLKKISGRLPGIEIKNKKDINDNVVVTDNSVQSREKLSLQKEPAIPAIGKADISHPDVAENLIANDKEMQLPVAGKEIVVKKDSITEDIATISQEELPVKTKVKKERPKINWGIELSGGISSNTENAFSFDGGQKSLVAADNLSSPLYNTGGGNPTIVYVPSSIQSGSAFRAGLVAEIKISKKSTVSSGLLYAYFSNSVKIGAYKDTIVAFSNSFSQAIRMDPVYRNYQEKEYITRFHFIQLPLQYQLQLNKGVKLPITWNIGGSMGYLLSTNGLVYNTTANRNYYQDDAAFNKLHWSLNTGFSFRLGSKNKIQWSLGPEVSLGMNKLTKDDYSRKQYLLYGGINGRIIFAKKK